MTRVGWQGASWGSADHWVQAERANLQPDSNTPAYGGRDRPHPLPATAGNAQQPKRLVRPAGYRRGQPAAGSTDGVVVCRHPLQFARGKGDRR
jgi:hypothetical protein